MRQMFATGSKVNFKKITCSKETSKNECGPKTDFLFSMLGKKDLFTWRILLAYMWTVFKIGNVSSQDKGTFHGV